MAVDAAGLPLAVILTPGQAGDNPQLLDEIRDIEVDERKVRVLADKAYTHPSTRQALRERRIKATIPERADQIARRKAKGKAGGRPPAFDPDLYKLRNVVERCFNRLNNSAAWQHGSPNEPLTTAPKSSSPASSSTSDEDPQDTPKTRNRHAWENGDETEPNGAEENMNKTRQM